MESDAKNEFLIPLVIIVERAPSSEFFSKTKCSVGGSASWSGVFCSAASRSAVAAGLNSRLIHHADVLTVYLL